MAQGSGMAVLIAGFIFATLCLAKEHDIGVWTLGKEAEYKQWAAQQAFAPGDTLIFQYSADAHNVWQLGTQEEYDACNVGKPIKVFNNANAVVSLASPGKHFYVCGVGTHCLGGMKVTINVVHPARPLFVSSPTPAPGSLPANPQHDFGPWVMGKQAQYKQWASEQTFVRGDSLKFEFSAGAHNVWELATQEDYENCNVNSPVRVYNEANAVVPLATAGKHFYVCGVGNGKHCLGGMKVTINVVDPLDNFHLGTPTLSPSAAPAPAPANRQHNFGPWVLGQQSEYRQWASEQRFVPGDTLKFEFAAGLHNVWELATQAEYDSCNVNSPIKVYNEANAVVPLEAGKHFYVCGVGNGKHCLGGMKVAVNVFPTMALTSGSRPSDGTVHSIGAWMVGMQAEYKQWASQQTFLPGDRLKFEFAAGVHNVWQLATQEEYDTCNVSSPIKVYNEENAVVPLETSGKHFLVCGVGNHCLGGMKVSINVGGALQTPAPAPAPQSGVASFASSRLLVIAGALIVLAFL